MGTKDIVLEDLIASYQAGESAVALSQRYSCNIWGVLNRLRKAGVEVRSASDQNRCELGPVATSAFSLVELVDGLVLGDGSIDRKGFLRLEQANVRASWVTHIQRLLEEVGCNSKIVPRPSRTRTIEGRTVHGQAGVLLYTKAYPEMKDQRERWYPDGKRKVPQDLRLTPFNVAQWFSGDGTYGPQGDLVLCTNRYTLDDVEFLAARLKQDLGVYALVGRTQRRGQYRINISKKDEALALAEMMRPHMEESCLYKLKHTRPALCGQLLPEQAAEIRSLASSGVSEKELEAMYNRCNTTIRNILTNRSFKGA